MNDSDKLKPILIENPHTKRMVNIAPFFDYINYYHEGNFYMAAKELDAAAVNIACTATDANAYNLHEHTSILHNLFTLRDAIDSISEFKEERR